MTSAISKILNTPRFVRISLLMAIDLFFTFVAIAIPYFLTTEAVVHLDSTLPLLLFPASVILFLAIFKIYKIVFRYINDQTIFTVASVLGLAAVVAYFPLRSLANVELPVLALAYFLSSYFILFYRFAIKRYFHSLDANRSAKTKIAIYGAGEAGRQIAQGLLVGNKYQPIAFFDDNSNLHGRTISGLPVYNPSEIQKVLQRAECQDVLISIPSADAVTKNKIIKNLSSLNLRLQTLPSLNDLAEGKVKPEDIREVEISDLLHRDIVLPDEQSINNFITSKVIAISGAGGSIGSELCRQIIKNNPKELILIESSEFALYQIDSELRKHSPQTKITARLCNVTEATFLEDIFKETPIDTVFHAAAYKHVPLIEDNIGAGAHNNIHGTKNMAEMAVKYSVKKFVLISTDKAVRPTNIMGATKRVAELILQALAAENPKTCFSMVRFGNVLGSSGSVIPLFKQQIKNGGPVTVTHPEITRYFMTIPEAAQLVIQAGAYATGGEVFILDMGKPVKIVELAKKMIHLSGYTVKDESNPKGEIEIKYSGLRPGEKLYEELLIDANAIKTNHAQIFKAQEPFLAKNELYTTLDKIEQACHKADNNQIGNLIKEIVKEYEKN